jgi:hypothetical protein
MNYQFIGEFWRCCTAAGAEKTLRSRNDPLGPNKVPHMWSSKARDVNHRHHATQACQIVQQSLGQLRENSGVHGFEEQKKVHSRYPS